MPVFRLTEEILFPSAERASRHGLLAVGGDLSPERLLLAYQEGIFPWFSEGEPPLWWSPDPRFVLLPEEVHISGSMKKLIGRGVFRVTFDRAFRAVIGGCRHQHRPGQRGTWITEEMEEAYCRLHELGFAHSVETWRDGELAGGLYGVSLGACFFGESMFTRVDNASKAALIHLCGSLQERRFRLIDCQVYTPHLRSLGARMIPRSRFLAILREALRVPTRKGKWGALGELSLARESSVAAHPGTEADLP
jgi:leucyl/phenylalanyl-tRNA---protein transferase